MYVCVWGCVQWYPVASQPSSQSWSFAHSSFPCFLLSAGKFYCKPHYCYRLSGYAQRKRPAVAPLSGKEAKGTLQDGPTADANGLASVATSSAERSPGTSMNGLEEPSIAKRLRGTPERIELENCRRSVRQVEELEEVPEETQAEHNLSSVLDKGTEEDVASSSSESEMEEEEEEDDEDDQLPTSDLGGVPWKEAVRIHALLKGRSEEELEASKNFEPEEEEEEEDYEEDEEYDEEEEEESSEAPLDEDDLEEDVDSEPAETEGEAAEDGDPGDTGVELDGMGPSLPSLPL